MRRGRRAIFVDYAHTPDADGHRAARALRPHVMGRIVAIVGAGGDRDAEQARPLMGRGRGPPMPTDLVIVNRRQPALRGPGRRSAPPSCRVRRAASEIGDRAEAILRGAGALEPGDALLMMGKGHETGQVLGDAVLPFDDVEQASIAVAALEGRIA